MGTYGTPLPTQVSQNGPEPNRALKTSMAEREKSRKYYREHRQELIEYQRRYRVENPEKLAARERQPHRMEKKRERAKRWKERNPDKYLLAREKDREKRRTPAGRMYHILKDARFRAGEKGLVFDESIIGNLVNNPPLACECCHLPFDFSVTGTRRHLAPSLDQFIPGGGYTPENTRVICYRCNWLKSDARIHEIENVLAYMKSNQGAGCGI